MNFLCPGCNGLLVVCVLYTHYKTRNLRQFTACTCGKIWTFRLTGGFTQRRQVWTEGFPPLRARPHSIPGVWELFNGRGALVVTIVDNEVAKTRSLVLRELQIFEVTQLPKLEVS